jgi:hypothetical protein
MTGRLLTTRELADYLGLSTESVLRRWRRGKIPGVGDRGVVFELECESGLASVRTEAYPASVRD